MNSVPRSTLLSFAYADEDDGEGGGTKVAGLSGRRSAQKMNLQATRLDAQTKVRVTPAHVANAPEFGELAVHRSRKRIAPFRLHVPHSVAEAVAMLCEYRPACIVAGGLDVINRMKAGDEHKDVVYIGNIDALRHIGMSQDLLHVGAACTHHELAASKIAARALPGLPPIWGVLANPRIRSLPLEETFASLRRTARTPFLASSISPLGHTTPPGYWKPSRCRATMRYACITIARLKAWRVVSLRFSSTARPFWRGVPP
jgi:hypothetical protein